MRKNADFELFKTVKYSILLSTYILIGLFALLGGFCL